MKKILILSLFFSFQISQGMGVFEMDDDSSSDQKELVNMVGEETSSDQQNFAASVELTDLSDQDEFSPSTFSSSFYQNEFSMPPTSPSFYQNEFSRPPVSSAFYQNEFSRSPISSSFYQEEFSKPPLPSIYPDEFSKPPMVSYPYQNEFSRPVPRYAQSSSESSSQSICIVPSASGYFSSDEYVGPHSFGSDEKLKEPIEYRRRNSTQVNSIGAKNADATLFKKKLEFYDKFPKETFHVSEINQAGWEEKPEDFHVTMLLGRHVGDKANMNKTAHTSSGHSEINLETVGIDKALSLMTLGCLFKFDAIAAGTSARHDTTARLISSFSADEQEYKLMKEFDEQKLGHLGGKHEKDILQNPEFVRMFTDPDYKMKVSETEEDENCETGSDVISRFTNGINKMIDSVNESRDVYVENHRANFSSIQDQQDYLNKNMLLYICTSRCTLNWMIKYFTGNMQLPLQLKTIQNCNLFCVNYYPNQGKFDVLLNNEDMPFCLTPLHFSQFALKSPVFSPFIQTFCQKVSRIIEKQDEKQNTKQQVRKQSNTDKLLRTVYLKMLSQSFSYHPEPKPKKRQRAKSN